MRTWAEVSLDRLAHNYHALRGLTPYGTKFMGLVKADAYGHGAVPIAQKLEELGADYLGVACLAEAVELRQAGVQTPILILGGTPGGLRCRVGAVSHYPGLLRLGLRQGPLGPRYKRREAP